MCTPKYSVECSSQRRARSASVHSRTSCACAAACRLWWTPHATSARPWPARGGLRACLLRRLILRRLRELALQLVLEAWLLLLKLLLSLREHLRMVDGELLKVGARLLAGMVELEARGSNLNLKLADQNLTLRRLLCRAQGRLSALVAGGVKPVRYTPARELGGARSACGWSRRAARA